jgi:anti-sigma regulatory factor (Ser/Thr protein kinase)
MTCLPMHGGVSTVRAPASPRAGAPEQDSGAGPAITGGWPLVSSLEMAALPSAVPCGRLHARQVAWEWGLEHLANDAEILASELLSNAIKASLSDHGDGLVTLRLLADREQLIVEVWDRSPFSPEPRQAGDDAENGRGLLVVEALSSRWGFRRVSLVLKVVWAELLL